MVDWELYELLLKNGEVEKTSRDAAIQDAVDTFTEGIVNDPAYQSDATVNGESLPIIASRESTEQCNIKAIPGSDLHIGDMVHCLDEEWIVTELYADKVGIINGIIKMCNKTISFQNYSETIHTRYCIVDDGSYSKNSKDPDASVMSNTYKIYLSIDNETKQLFVDKRLGLGSIYAPLGEKVMEVYDIIGIDLTSKNYGDGSHLMMITAQRGMYNPDTDNMELNLCDVYIPEDEDKSASSIGYCDIQGRDVIRIGTTRKYTPSFYDANSSEITENTPTPVWTITLPTGSNISYSETNGVVSLTAPISGSDIGSEITLELTDSDGAYGTCEKKVKVVTIG